MDRESKKKKNQSIVIELQRLLELHSKTIMKIKQKVIMSRKSSRKQIYRGRMWILSKMVVPFQM